MDQYNGMRLRYVVLEGRDYGLFKDYVTFKGNQGSNKEVLGAFHVFFQVSGTLFAILPQIP